MGKATIYAALLLSGAIAIPPAFSAIPVIQDQSNVAGSGLSIPLVGNMALANVTTSGGPTLSYQWYRTANTDSATRTAISLPGGGLATGPTYTYATADTDCFVSCVVTASLGGLTATAETVPTLPVAAPGIGLFPWSVQVFALQAPGGVGPQRGPTKKIGVDAFPGTYKPYPATANSQLNIPGGTASSPVTYDGWDFRGSQPTVQNGAGYITFSNCLFDSSSFTLNGAVLILKGASNILVDHCTFDMSYGHATDAIGCTYQGTLTSDNVEIRYCRFLHNPSDSILIFGFGCKIHHNLFDRPIAAGTAHPDFISFGHGSATIYSNYFNCSQLAVNNMVRLSPAGGAPSGNIGGIIYSAEIYNNIGQGWAGSVTFSLSSGSQNTQGSSAVMNVSVHDNLVSKGLDGSGSSLSNSWWQTGPHGVMRSDGNYNVYSAQPEIEIPVSWMPVLTTPPSLNSTTAVVGTQITATDGVYDRAVTLSYQWVYDDATRGNAGANSAASRAASYTPVAADVNRPLARYEYAVSTGTINQLNSSRVLVPTSNSVALDSKSSNTTTATAPAS